MITLLLLKIKMYTSVSISNSTIIILYMYIIYQMKTYCVLNFILVNTFIYMYYVYIHMIFSVICCRTTNSSITCKSDNAYLCIINNMSVIEKKIILVYLLRTSKQTMGFWIGFIILNKHNILAIPLTPSPSQVYILILIFKLDMFKTVLKPFIWICF